MRSGCRSARRSARRPYGGSTCHPAPTRNTGSTDAMDADYFLGVANQTMWVLALAAAPVLIPALLAGLILGMVQAATSINEQTLTFVPKLIVVAVCLAIFGGSIMILISGFTTDVFNTMIPEIVK